MSRREAGLPSTNHEYSGFANVTQHFNQAFDISGGVRYGCQGIR